VVDGAVAKEVEDEGQSSGLALRLKGNKRRAMSRRRPCAVKSLAGPR
jgi:hypothetical protein